MDGNRKKSFCILRRLFTPNFRSNRLYKNKETKQYKVGSVKPTVKSSASKIFLECLILCCREKPIRREMTSFYCHWQNPFLFSCHILFDNPRQVYITKTLICIRNKTLKYSSRSSQKMSLCKSPFNFGQQLTGASLDTIPETIAARISAPVPLSFCQYRYHRLSTSESTLDSRKRL